MVQLAALAADRIVLPLVLFRLGVQLVEPSERVIAQVGQSVETQSVFDDPLPIGPQWLEAQGDLDPPGFPLGFLQLGLQLAGLGIDFVDLNRQL
ncbi:MAG: hypothetical protein AAF368_11265, partial [Planctomycetota bacterium]